MKLFFALLGCATIAACNGGQDSFDGSQTTDARADVAATRDVALDASRETPDASESPDAAIDAATDAPRDPCAAALTCGACVSVTGCGFCNATGACATAGADGTGSADGTCTGSDWESTMRACRAGRDGGSDDGGGEPDAFTGDAGGACTSDAECDALDYCMPASMGSTGGVTCGAPGHCQPRPTRCGDGDGGTMMVCGCDGHDYASLCAAHRAGTAATHPGPCARSGDAGIDPLRDR